MAKSFRQFREEISEWDDDDIEIKRKEWRLEDRRNRKKDKAGKRSQFDGDEE